MLRPEDTFHASFELDMAQEPPLRFVIAHGMGKVVNHGMTGSDSLEYAEPNLGQPGAGQTSRGKELEAVAQSLQEALVKRKLTSFSLKPAQEGHVSVDEEGREKSATPASAEVLRFILRTVLHLRAAQKA